MDIFREPFAALSTPRVWMARRNLTLAVWVRAIRNSLRRRYEDCIHDRDYTNGQGLVAPAVEGTGRQELQRNRRRHSTIHRAFRVPCSSPWNPVAWEVPVKPARARGTDGFAMRVIAKSGRGVRAGQAVARIVEQLAV